MQQTHRQTWLECRREVIKKGCNVLWLLDITWSAMLTYLKNLLRERLLPSGTSSRGFNPARVCVLCSYRIKKEILCLALIYRQNPNDCFPNPAMKWNIKKSSGSLCCASWKMTKRCHACLSSHFLSALHTDFKPLVLTFFLFFLLPLYPLHPLYNFPPSSMSLCFSLSPRGWLIKSWPSCMRRE